MEENWVYGDDLKAHEIDHDSAIQGFKPAIIKIMSMSGKL